MTKQLFPDQSNFVTNIRKLMTQSKRIIACAATGFGKTVVFLHIAEGATTKFNTCLIITEAKKIYKGIRKERPDAVLIDPSVKYIYIEPGKIYLAMAQTLKNRQGILSQFSALGNRLLVVNDEAHIDTASPIIEGLPEAYIIGATATPDYRVAKHLPKIYQSIVVGPQPAELVESGRLTPYFHFEKKSADLSTLKKGGNGEYTEKSNEFTFDRATVYSGFEQDLIKIPYRKACVFCATIKHANHVAESLRADGYKVAVVHTGNPNSDLDLYEFETSEDINLCVTVGQILKGYDFPKMDVGFILRAFGSLPNYLQCVGRFARKFPGKDKFTIYDYGGNRTRHGLWIEERDWASMWLPKKGKKKDGIAPMKECPQCFLLSPSTVRYCVECGYQFPVIERELAEGVMVDAMAEYNSIRGRWIGSLTPSELATYARTTNKRNYATRIARTLDADKPGYLEQYGHLMGYKSGWKNHQSGQGVGFADVPIR